MPRSKLRAIMLTIQHLLIPEVLSVSLVWVLTSPPVSFLHSSILEPENGKLDAKVEIAY